MTRSITLELLEHQDDLLSSTHKYPALIGGRGSGKTFVGGHFALNKVYDYPDALGLIGANSYKQLNNSTLKGAFKEWDRIGVDYDYKENKGILNLEGTEIICCSMEKYDNLRGLEIGWGWVDEVRDMKKAAHTMLIACLRDQRCLQRQLMYTTTPAGFNWLKDYFDGELKTKDYHMINASTKDNPHLPDDFYDSLEQSYDEKLLEQEAEGKFLNITQGRVYYQFDRKLYLDSSIAYDPNKPLLIGMDFNVNPMTASLSHFVNGRLLTFDEAYIMGSDTEEMGIYIKEKYGLGRIIPDSTGKRKQTSSSGESDHSILRDMGFRIAEVENPHRSDRYNSVNNAFKKNWLGIHPRCKELIKDLERNSYKQGTSFIDDSDHERTHMGDGYGYKVYFLFPSIKKNDTIITYTSFR